MSELEEEGELLTPEEALLDCSRYGDYDDVVQILDCEEPRVNINCVDGSGNSPLHLAAANGHAAIVGQLITHGARLAVNASGNTPLHWALQLGHVDSLRLLLEMPEANVTVKNGFGKSLMSTVLEGGVPEALSEMIMRHPSVVFEPEPEDGVEEGGEEARSSSDEESDGEGEEGTTGAEPVSEACASTDAHE